MRSELFSVRDEEIDMDQRKRSLLIKLYAMRLSGNVQSIIIRRLTVRRTKKETVAVHRQKASLLPVVVRRRKTNESR